MIIGLTGYAGSGKDTVAEILVRDHGFVRYAFADKLRELAYSINPTIVWDSVGGDPCYATLQQIVDSDGWDNAKRGYGGRVREILQRVGVWHRDNVSEDFWVDFVSRQWHGDGRPNAVITDVRFPNEAAWVRGASFLGRPLLQGQLWRVQRPGVGPVNGHISEQLELAADATIWNGGSKASLMLKVNQLVREEAAA